MSINTPQRVRLYEQGGKSVNQLLGIISFGFFQVSQQFALTLREFIPERVDFLSRELDNWIDAATQLCFYLHISNSVEFPPDDIAQLGEQLDQLEESLEAFRESALGPKGPRDFFHLSHRWIDARNTLQNILDDIEDNQGRQD